MDLEHVREEIGDTLWYAVVLAADLGISLEEVCWSNIDKLDKRFPNGYSDKAAIDRADK